MTDYQTIDAAAFAAIKPQDGVILDVRTAMEHGENRLACSHDHVPLDQIKPTDFMLRRGLDKSAKVYILCRSGARARKAADLFKAEGYNNVIVVEGGLIACEAAGYATAKQNQNAAPSSSAAVAMSAASIPLERQVRIAAGGMAAVGAFLALFVHPLFALIPLFVGGGLIYAGVTDRCGLALVLTKMPWNKGASCPSGTCGITQKAGQSCQ